MRTYEFALILTQEAGKDDNQKKSHVEELLLKVKGKITDTKILGLKDLAYPIKKQAKGWYGFFKIELPEEAVKKLDTLAKQDEKILRYLLVREG